MATSQIFVDDSRVGQGVAFVAALVKSAASVTVNTEGKVTSDWLLGLRPKMRLVNLFAPWVLFAQVAFVDASGTFSELKAVIKVRHMLTDLLASFWDSC
jgi:hypothetical protein